MHVWRLIKFDDIIDSVWHAQAALTRRDPKYTKCASQIVMMYFHKTHNQQHLQNNNMQYCVEENNEIDFH